MIIKKLLLLIISPSLLIGTICSYGAKPHAMPINTQTLTRLNPKFISLPQGKLEYYRFGKGTPIILIAGYATNVSSWNKDFLIKLAEQHDVIVFNNRNVDGSFVKSKSYTAADLARDTDQLILQLHLNKPTIVGISMGGMIAQQLAVMYPKQISHLVLINTAISGRYSVEPNPNVKAIILHTPKGKLKRFIVVMKLLAPPDWRLPLAISLIRDRFQPANASNLLGVSESTLKQQQDLILGWAKNNIVAKQLAQLQVPALILSGGADAVIPPINSTILAKTIPHAKLYRWKDGGHAMIYQYPVSIANTINQFLKN